MKTFWPVFFAIMAAVVVVLGGYGLYRRAENEKATWKELAQLQAHSVEMVTSLCVGEPTEERIVEFNATVRSLRETAKRSAFTDSERREMKSKANEAIGVVQIVARDKSAALVALVIPEEP